MAISKSKMNIKTESGYATIYPETSADQAQYDNSVSGLTATNVQTAIDELNTKASGAAQKWTTARSITATGNATGVTWIDGSENVLFPIAVKRWETARNITLTGGVTGTIPISGDSDVSMTTVVTNNSHTHTVANVTGLQTALDGKLATSGGTVTGNITVTGTITGQTAVYGAFFNDYAELFRKRPSDTFKEGDVLELDNEGYVVLSSSKQSKAVVGAVSYSYGHLLGGTGEESDRYNYIPVGLCGVIPVKYAGEVSVGDILYASDKAGIASTYSKHITGTGIGKVRKVISSEYVEMLIMLC